MNSNYKKKSGETVITRGIREYPSLREKMESVEEIAEVLGCTPQYIYNYIIPKLVENGYNHDELIYFPHKKAQFTVKPGRPKGSKNSVPTATESLTEFSVIESDLAETRNILNSIMESLEGGIFNE